MEEIISRIVEEWFLTEPLLFSTWCTHTMMENTRMTVPMRTGKARIEYNPDLMKNWRKVQVKERLRFEVIRILLGHPYQRQPYKAKKATLGMASDVTLTSSYHKINTITLPEGLCFDDGLCFEEYYAIVENFLDQNLSSTPYGGDGEIDDGGGQKNSESLQQLASQASESAELWEEDQLVSEQVKETVRRAQRGKQWGSVGGNLKGRIEATTIVRIDYRTILSGFCASVLSSKRSRTRMIPSRRYGFQYMGSKLNFATRLLVAIDVSGSISNRQISQALSIINRFFKCGVERVDIIQFDCGLQGNILTMKKMRKFLRITGRGGTDFQAPLDFFFENCYDGLIMLTDGYASRPKFPERFHGNILWMIYNDEVYRRQGCFEPDTGLGWIASLPKSKYAILPPV